MLRAQSMRRAARAQHKMNYVAQLQHADFYCCLSLVLHKSLWTFSVMQVYKARLQCVDDGQRRRGDG